MKNWLVVLGFLAFLSCNDDSNDIEGVWIEKYYVHRPDQQDEEIGLPSHRHILSFQKDRVILKYLETYSQDVDSVILIRQNGVLASIDDNGDLVDSVEIYTSKDNLEILTNGWGYPQKIILEKLPRFNLANQQKSFEKLLENNSFSADTDTSLLYFIGNDNITFNHQHLYFDNLIEEIPSLKYWKTEVRNGELFLIIGGNSLRLVDIQIQSFSKNGFSGVHYTVDNQFIHFKIQSQSIQPKFSKKLLLGKWEEQLSEDEKSILPPPEVVKDTIFCGAGILEFLDSTFIQCKNLKVDTLDWSFNRFGNMLLYSKDHDKYVSNQWKILDLDECIKSYERKIFKLSKLLEKG